MSKPTNQLNMMDTNNNTSQQPSSKDQILCPNQVEIANGHGNGHKAPEKLWDPETSTSNLRPTQLTEFQKLVNSKYNLKLGELPTGCLPP